MLLHGPRTAVLREETEFTVRLHGVDMVSGDAADLWVWFNGVNVDGEGTETAVEEAGSASDADDGMVVFS